MSLLNEAIYGVGNSLDNVIIGGVANNLLFGAEGNDYLSDDVGNDKLNGGWGNDTLAGGSGNDTLTGGLGNDHFVFESSNAFQTEGFGVDTLVDFEAGDTIVLEKGNFSALSSLAGTGFSVASEFAVVTTDAAALSSALVVYNRNNGSLFYNRNRAAAGFELTTGDSTGGQFATLSSSPVLTANNFVLTNNFSPSL